MFRIYDYEGYPILHEFKTKDEAEEYAVANGMAEYQILTLEEVSEWGEGYELGLLKPFDYWVPTE